MSTRSLPGPIHAIPVDDDREKLRKQNDKLQRENEDLRLENQKLQMENRRTVAAVAALKKFLSPLFGSLKVIFGEFDAMDLEDIAEPSASPVSHSHQTTHPKFSNALSRIDGAKHDVLKLIMDLGPQTIKGMMAALHIGQQTAYDTTSYLGRMGLIKKQDGKFRLTED